MLGVRLLLFVFAYFQAVLLTPSGSASCTTCAASFIKSCNIRRSPTYDRQPVGRIMTRLTSDVDALNELFTSGIIDVLGDLVMIFAIIGIMLGWIGGSRSSRSSPSRC